MIPASREALPLSSSSSVSHRSRRKLRDETFSFLGRLRTDDVLCWDNLTRKKNNAIFTWKKQTLSSTLNFFIDLLLINLISQAGTGIETTKVCVII